MKQPTKINSSIFIFIIIAIFYATGNLIWLLLNTPIIPRGISAIHFLDIFREGWLFYNAPLLTWIMRGMFFIFGKEYFDLIVIFVNYIFFLIPLYFIYKLGIELKDKQTGNIAMILFALTPAIYGMSRQYGHQDYHIIAAITFNIYCLIKTNYFTNRKWAIIYGISVGLGLLIKDAFLAYFFVPWLYVAIKSLIQRNEKNIIVNIILTIFIGSLISGCHYFREQIITKLLYEPITEAAPIFQFETVRIMIISFWEILLSPPIFLIFCFSLIWFINKYKDIHNKIIILLWIIIPWSIITFMPHFKLPEYEAGFIPAIILIVSLYLSSIINKLFKIIIISALILICLSQYVIFSYFINSKLLNAIYYNIKDENIIYYNIKERDIILSFIQQLQAKYFYNTFYLWDFACDFSTNFQTPKYFFEIIMLFNIYSFSYFYDTFGKLSTSYDNLYKSDIIINIGSLKTSEEMLLKLQQVYSKYPFLENYCNINDRTFEKIIKLINQNFHIIDIFDLSNTQEINNKIILLGSNIKFKHSTEAN